MRTLLTMIEDNCKILAEQRARLRKKYEAKQQAILTVNAAHDAAIRGLQTECALTRMALLVNLEAGRELFQKPKSRAYHGITVGFEKQRGTLNLPDEAILVDRIEKLLPAAQAATVLDRSVSLIKAAFKKLPRETLQLLGCSVVSGADQAIIHAQDDDIEALVGKSTGIAVEGEP